MSLPTPPETPAPPAPEPDARDLQRALDALSADYRARYAHVIFDLSVRPGAGGKGVLAGRVLLAAQLEEAARRLEALVGATLERDVVVLADAAAPAPFVQVRNRIADVFRAPEGAHADELSTQALASDPPLRLLDERGDRSLVQLWDLTLGWVPSASLEPVDPADAPGARWSDLRRPGAGQVLPVDAPVAALLEAGRRLAGVPYVLGGADPERGLDCSALVQRVYWEQAGIVLPKHTGDQRRMGLRVTRADIVAGDLLFFKSRERSFGHVALALEDEGRTVLHAALGNGDVREEPLSSVLEAYAYLGARRIARFATAAVAGAPMEACPAEPCGPIDLAHPESLRGARVHVVGVAGAEGAAIVRFLVEHGVTGVTAHDFSTPELFEKNFRLSHVGLDPRERGARLREMLAMPVRLCHRDHYLDGIEQAQVIFLPQGWFLYDSNAPVRALRERGDIVFSHMTDLYFRLAPCRIAAVTGTNGKSTTTRLLADILETAPFPHLFAGNDRRNVQVLDRLERFAPEGVLVLEVSNRQLIDLEPRPHVAVVTNVTPDHVEEHGTFDDYIAVKRKIVARQAPTDFAVLNRDHPVAWSFAGGTRARVFPFGRADEGIREDGAWLVGDSLVLCRDGEVHEICTRGDLQVPGMHNVSNVLAASMAAWLCGVHPERIGPVVRAFRGIGLRQEVVAQRGGVQFVNDVKATTPEAATVAVEAFDAPLHLIVGGGDKGLDYARFCRRLCGRARTLLVLDSPGGRRIMDALAQVAMGEKPRVVVCGDLAEAVERAARAAEPGDVVMLSPACPGMFSMYMDEQRGFGALVQGLAEPAADA